MSESFYFQHDYNAKSDQKILMLRGEFGLDGYALFWMCLETMAEDKKGYINKDAIGGLSVSYGTAKDYLQKFLKYCIETKLFDEDEHGIFSHRMMEHKKLRAQLSQAGSAGAKKRWGGHRVAIADPMQRKGKERKGNKEKESIGEPQQKTTNESWSELIGPYLGTYAPSMIDSFTDYWRARNPNGKKERWEMEKVFDMSRRLATWKRKDEQWEHQRNQRNIISLDNIPSQEKNAASTGSMSAIGDILRKEVET